MACTKEIMRLRWIF